MKNTVQYSQSENWYLTYDESILLKDRRFPHKLAMAVQLKQYQSTGFFPKTSSEITNGLVSHLSDQLETNDSILTGYNWSGRTARNHREEILRGCFEICHFNLLSITLVIAKYINASLVVCSSLSWSLEVLRWNDIHAKVLSTTHRFGSTLNLPWSVRSTMESAHPQWWATQPLRDSPR